MTPEEIVVRHVTDTGFADLPDEVIASTKNYLIDFLGIAIAGSKAAGIQGVMEQVSEWGGSPQSTVIVYGAKLPAPHAALVNGMMAHALDFDDTHDESCLHATTPVIAAALAAAESIGGISGKDLIAAVAIGTDIGCRLAAAVRHSPAATGWHTTATYGVFSASAAVGKLLKLDEEKMWNAFGLAYSQAAGNVQSVFDGALSKRLQAGLAAKAGVLSAHLAARGVTGPKRFLTGEYGFYNVYERGDWDIQRLTVGIGRTFEVTSLSMKPYPCCRRMHACVDVALELARKHHVKPEDVASIRVQTIKETHLSLVEKAQRHPRTVVDAQFSIPYVVATAILRGDVGIEHFSEEAIQDPEVTRLAEKVQGDVIQQQPDQGEHPARVDITLRDGSVVSGYQPYPKGHPRNPLSREEVFNKFKKCCKHAARPLSPSSIERIPALVEVLEEVRDVAELIEECGCTRPQGV